MTGSTLYFTMILIIALAALTGAFFTRTRAHREINRLTEENAILVTKIEIERLSMSEKIAIIEKAREQLTNAFAALSNQALKSNTEEFLKMAQENLRQLHEKNEADMANKEKNIDALLQPVKDALEKTERQLHQLELDRKEAYGSLTKHLESMTQTQQILQNETRNLVQALRRPEVRGQWGEMTLKRLAELAGMVEHCDFYEQEQVETEEGKIRPDMIVRMPDQRVIVVDVKTPLDAYLSAIEAPDDGVRTWHLERHARKVRERVRELSGRSYWAQFEHSPEFVVMFVPGDQFLSSALDVDRDLLEYALEHKVILSTPTSFVALLRAVAYGWRQQSLATNAEKIRDLGEDLYKRLNNFAGHLTRLGKNLNISLDHYNKAVGSFENQVVPGAKKFTELGISSSKPLEEPEKVEKTARRLGEAYEEEEENDRPGNRTH